MRSILRLELVVPGAVQLESPEVQIQQQIQTVKPEHQSRVALLADSRNQVLAVLVRTLPRGHRLPVEPAALMVEEFRSRVPRAEFTAVEPEARAGQQMPGLAAAAVVPDTSVEVVGTPRTSEQFRPPEAAVDQVIQLSPGFKVLAPARLQVILQIQIEAGPETAERVAQLRATQRRELQVVLCFICSNNS
jgi:hypothetical protein